MLIRGALSGFDPPLDGDELAGLACDADVESRIVVTEPGPRYMLREGPFAAEDFAELGDRDWTLLVQDVDKQLPGLAPFLDRFAFIPSWRIDDLMISWAADGGSVGPHVDRYDVFLYQATGRRRWRVGKPDDGAPHIPDNELQILADFEVTDEWLLEPGDMLYLPPGVPHWGVAEGPCITWSIGFRAPSAEDLFGNLFEYVTAGLTEADRYVDQDLAPDEADDGRLSLAAIDRARALFDRHLARATDGFARRFAGDRAQALVALRSGHGSALTRGARRAHHRRYGAGARPARAAGVARRTRGAVPVRGWAGTRGATAARRAGTDALRGTGVPSGRVEALSWGPGRDDAAGAPVRRRAGRGGTG